MFTRFSNDDASLFLQCLYEFSLLAGGKGGGGGNEHRNVEVCSNFVEGLLIRVKSNNENGGGAERDLSIANMMISAFIVLVRIPREMRLKESSTLSPCDSEAKVLTVAFDLIPILFPLKEFLPGASSTYSAITSATNWWC